MADTLNHAEVYTCEFAQNLENVDHTSSLHSVTINRLQQLKHASAFLQVLQKILRCGWPESKSDVPESIQPYFGQDELTPQDKFVFKSGHSFCDDDDGSGTC